MAKSIFPAFLVLFFSLKVLAQPCIPSSITLNTQNQVNNFAAAHPGCTEIEGALIIQQATNIVNLNGLSHITAIKGGLVLTYTANLTNFSGLANAKIGGKLIVEHNSDLTSLSALHFDSTLSSIFISANPKLANLKGLDSVRTVAENIVVESCPKLTALSGLENLVSVGGSFELKSLQMLQNLEPLGQLKSIGGEFKMQFVGFGPDMHGLESLKSIGSLYILNAASVQSLAGLENLDSIGHDLVLYQNAALDDISALAGVKRLENVLEINTNLSLKNLDGLQNVARVGQLDLAALPNLKNLDALQNLDTIDYGFYLTQCDSVASLAAFSGLQYVGGQFVVSGNHALSDCAVQSLCELLFLSPDAVILQDNAPGCNDQTEVKGQCPQIKVEAAVYLDFDGDCLPDANNAPASETTVLFSAPGQSVIQPSKSDGKTIFDYFGQDPLAVSLPQLPSEHWAVCPNTGQVDPANIPSGDTAKVVFLLKPLQNCPKLDVRLALPSEFRAECNARSQVKIVVRNFGTLLATTTQTALVLPPAFSLEQADPPLAAQNGDTLFFNTSDIAPYGSALVNLTIQTRCSGFSPGQTFCWESFATAQNACAVPPLTASEIQASSICTGDSVIFLLKNIGQIATQGPHGYKIIKNHYVESSGSFSLAAGQTLRLAVPADGSTWRVEATKLDDGTRTAAFFEACGPTFTPGEVVPFWQERGPSGHDFDCRAVVAASKTALLLPIWESVFPTGVFPSNRIPAGQPILHTIEFQNTGTGTVASVRISENFSPGWDVLSFRPIAASHPYEWFIRDEQLEIRFPNIQLPDSNANAAASKGFFTFRIGQTPGLADGDEIYSSSLIFFDGVQQPSNNVVSHKIGEPFPGNVSCAPDGIVFYGQTAVDQFEISYPGCTVIEGPVTLQGPDIGNLEGLKSVRYMGHLRMFNNYSLADFRGLENLDSLGDLFLVNNFALKSMHGLESVIKINGSLSIYGNPAFESFAGLDNLRSIGGDFSVEGASLTNFNGLGQLESIGGYFNGNANWFSHDFTGLDNLKTIGGDFSFAFSFLGTTDGLGSLESIGGNLDFSECPIFSSVAGLSKLKTIGGNFLLVNTPIEQLTGLDSLTSIGGNFDIKRNDKLNWINGLGNLQTIGGDLAIEECDGLLYNLPDFRNLHTVQGSLSILSNTYLNNLEGFEHLQTVGGGLYVVNNALLVSLAGLDSLRSIGGFFNVSNSLNLTQLDGLPRLVSAGAIVISENPNLAGITGLGNLDSIGFLTVNDNPKLVDINGLGNLRVVDTLGIGISNNPMLQNLDGLAGIQKIGGSVHIRENHTLTNLNGFENLESLGHNLEITYNQSLTTLGTGFKKLKKFPGGIFLDLTFLTDALVNLAQIDTIGGSLSVHRTTMPDLNGLQNVKYIGGSVELVRTDLQNLHGLENLNRVGGNFVLSLSPLLADVSALSSLKTVGASLGISDMDILASLAGLEGLTHLGGNLEINYNPILASLAGLSNLASVGEVVRITGNPALSDCAVFALCDYLTNFPGQAQIHQNATGCDSEAEVVANCQATPVLVTVLLDQNADCLPDGGDLPIEAVQILLTGSLQNTLRPSGTAGRTQFGFLEKGTFTLSLPEFPTAHWTACVPEIQLNAPAGQPDTLKATFVLEAATQCPELTTELALPTNFRGCLVNSEVRVSTKNTGAARAEGVKTAVVVPPVFEIISALPLPAGQQGDTLLFEMGDLFPFGNASVQLTVKTKCDTFLFSQTLCWEAFAVMDNPCPTTLPAFSEIKLSAICVGDSLVRFTLKNIGDAPTQAPHEYRIVRNDIANPPVPFSLANQQTMTVDLPADGATYRMEATKLNDGTRTATALEHCGGLTPGWITAFWLEKGGPAYDFDCRPVIGSFDPNQKSALPTGAGSNNAIEANRPLEYTIDFQNTGTDTAFRVLLRDVLPSNLAIATFRPVAASDSCMWQIRGNTLEVLFQPITLPDSNVNEPASHGFFTFEIEQKPNLPDGTVFENTASIVFDFNPPIITNTVHHTIGRLIVRVDEPRQHLVLWQVWGNPTREVATFVANEPIEGEKRFDMFDAAGCPVRTEQFSGQTFEFKRNGLSAGWYAFRISDARGRVFAGKIVVVE